MRAHLVFVLFVVALALVGGCDSGSLPTFQGADCKQTSDCNSGLQCLDYATVVDGGCTSLGMQCVQTCLSSSDCTSAGAGFGCYSVCGGPAVCQPAVAGEPDGGTD
jgi:hypothetical protein